MHRRLAVVLLILLSARAGLSSERPVGRSFATRSVVYARHGMVAAAHPLAVQIGVDVLKRVALGADMSAREVVVLVPAYRQHLAIRVLNLQPTHRLAERAGAVVQARRLFHVNPPGCPSPADQQRPPEAARPP